MAGYRTGTGGTEGNRGNRGEMGEARGKRGNKKVLTSRGPKRRGGEKEGERVIE